MMNSIAILSHLLVSCPLSGQGAVVLAERNEVHPPEGDLGAVTGAGMAALKGHPLGKVWARGENGFVC